MRSGLDKQQATYEICQGGERAEQQQSGESSEDRFHQFLVTRTFSITTIWRATIHHEERLGYRTTLSVWQTIGVRI